MERGLTDGELARLALFGHEKGVVVSGDGETDSRAESTTSTSSTT